MLWRRGLMWRLLALLQLLLLLRVLLHLLLCLLLVLLFNLLFPRVVCLLLGHFLVILLLFLLQLRSFLILLGVQLVLLLLIFLVEVRISRVVRRILGCRRNFIRMHRRASGITLCRAIVFRMVGGRRVLPAFSRRNGASSSKLSRPRGR